MVRNLNLSYNPLQFDPEKPQYEPSIKFIENMVEYIKITDVLNHISVQGMGFLKQQLLDLCGVMCTCPNLLAVHLSDNGIIRDEETMVEVLEVFSLGSIDVKHLTRSKFEIHRGA